MAGLQPLLRSTSRSKPIWRVLLRPAGQPSALPPHALAFAPAFLSVTPARESAFVGAQGPLALRDMGREARPAPIATIQLPGPRRRSRIRGSRSLQAPESTPNSTGFTGCGKTPKEMQKRNRARLQSCRKPHKQRTGALAPAPSRRDLTTQRALPQPL